VFRYSDRQYFAQDSYFGQGKPRKKYGFFSFVFDILLVILTSGFWLIWIFIREMRKA
jgi:hypothetical protein